MTGAVPYTDIKNFADNLVFLSQTNSVGYLIAEVIQDWIDDNEDYWDLELSQEDINNLLKALTGCVVATGTDLSCYPLGEVTQILFDNSGNPIP